MKCLCHANRSTGLEKQVHTVFLSQNLFNIFIFIKITLIGKANKNFKGTFYNLFFYKGIKSANDKRRLFKDIKDVRIEVLHLRFHIYYLSYSTYLNYKIFLFNSKLFLDFDSLKRKLMIYYYKPYEKF